MKLSLETGWKSDVDIAFTTLKELKPPPKNLNKKKVKKWNNLDMICTTSNLVINKVDTDRGILGIVMFYIGLDWRKPVFGECGQQMHRPACADAQSDQHLCYSLIGKYRI